MSTGSTTVRTLAVRINDDPRARLDLIAQLNERSITEESRLALESWVKQSKTDPKVLALSLGFSSPADAVA